MFRISLILICSVTLLGGCSSQKAPEFVLNTETLQLAKKAQAVVNSELQAGFGTPSSLVAWSVLPVDFAEVKGTVKSTEDGAITLAVSEQSPLAGVIPAKSFSGAVLLSGKDSSRLITAFDIESGKVQFSHNIEGIATNSEVQVIGGTLPFGRNLYLRHCVHCHGVSGDGDGPTAKYLTPRPRDYRKGVLKFTSTATGVRPSRDDVVQIIKNGVPGTYMPSFMLLPDREVQAIVEYVRWLSMRGEFESKLAAQMGVDFSQAAAKDTPGSEFETQLNEFVKSDLPSAVADASGELKDDWTAPEQEENLVIPKSTRTPSSAESIKRGREIFLGTKAKCAACHGEQARGDGPSTEIINDKPGKPGEKGDVPGLFDIWGNIVKPRNLHQGMYRGGRRPIDIYRRVYAGIKGTPMQAFGTTLTEQEIWDVVNYVLNVPFEEKH